ncbi:hypothetical protein H6F74_19335 [Trichocoleus sp. FACHB-90]|uniref:hypothetical protein n=1 Tax=Cyanophyceae TaxID=3028117 RepID=UPI00168975C4|nr:hypothetical protein [Trichocoleus sp. FACHB-90]MBD1928384.1 hypothetical protein [Trichocoleus sp. FACHB-90]
MTSILASALAQNPKLLLRTSNLEILRINAIAIALLYASRHKSQIQKRSSTSLTAIGSLDFRACNIKNKCDRYRSSVRF